MMVIGLRILRELDVKRGGLDVDRREKDRRALEAIMLKDSRVNEVGENGGRVCGCTVGVVTVGLKGINFNETDDSQLRG